jgi:hypothetical protein
MIREVIKKILKEATSDGGQSRGSYILPMQPGLRIFDKSQLAPFNIEVSDFENAELYADSLDGNMDVSEHEIRKMENVARKIANFKKKHPIQNDEDGDNINPYPSKINETSTSVSAGEYSGPLEIGMKKWSKSELGPFQEFVDKEYNHKKVKSSTKNNIKNTVGMWEKGKDGTYNIDTHPVHTIKEDLAVWFGTKKKPKGSKQPKGPWVNICRKVDGKHPPCGRSEATDKAYPKCRAAGVAGKMSDSEKRSACQQKRKAEKTHSKSGTGNKPKMVSYKPNNEDVKLLESELRKIIKKLIN